MCKYRLPDTQFKFVEEIWYKHSVVFKSIWSKTFRKGILYRKVRNQTLEWREHTRVGTRECSRRIFSTRSLPASIPSSYIKRRALSTFAWCESLSFRALKLWVCMSDWVPRSPILVLRIRHCGHGHPPRYLIVARRILMTWGFRE